MLADLAAVTHTRFSIQAHDINPPSIYWNCYLYIRDLLPVKCGNDVAAEQSCQGGISTFWIPLQLQLNTRGTQGHSCAHWIANVPNALPGNTISHNALMIWVSKNYVLTVKRLLSERTSSSW